MPALRTTLVAVGIGAATLTTGAVVATSATAAPAPLAAVERLSEPVTTEPATAGTASYGTASDGTVRTKARRWWTGLTDAQRTCLQDQEVTRPVGPLDDTERAALRAEVEAAAKACDVTLPLARARAFWDGLTSEQQTCLKEADVNRPWGPLTKEQRQAVRADVRAAAEACGVTLPPRQG